MLISQKIKPIFFLILLCLFSTSIYAQPPHKARERIETLKKMKMLEVLDLDESASEKFLLRYKALDVKIKEKERLFDDAARELKGSVESKDKSEMVKKSDKFLKAQSEMHQAMSDKLFGMKQVLTDEQFAKYLLFEKRFNQELRRMMMEKSNQGKFRNSEE